MDYNDAQSSEATLPTNQPRVYIRRAIVTADIGQNTATTTFICAAVDTGLTKFDTCPAGGGWRGSRDGLLAMSSPIRTSRAVRLHYILAGVDVGRFVGKEGAAW